MKSNHLFKVITAFASGFFLLSCQSELFAESLPEQCSKLATIFGQESVVYNQFIDKAREGIITSQQASSSIRKIEQKLLPQLKRFFSEDSRILTDKELLIKEFESDIRFIKMWANDRIKFKIKKGFMKGGYTTDSYGNKQPIKITSFKIMIDGKPVKPGFFVKREDWDYYCGSGEFYHGPFDWSY